MILRDLLFVPFQAQDASTVPALAAIFLKSGARVILVQLDVPIPDIPEGCELVVRSGWKFTLALDIVAGQPFRKLFVWDADLDARGFDPVRFGEIMDHNWLDMAHPALTRDSFQDWQNGFENPSVISEGFAGRYMSALPVMASVFSPTGWQRFRKLFDGFHSGELWSYGFAQVGNLGFVDAMPVRHTRFTTGTNGEAEREQLIERMHLKAKAELGVLDPCRYPADRMECGRLRSP